MPKAEAEEPAEDGQDNGCKAEIASLEKHISALEQAVKVHPDDTLAAVIVAKKAELDDLRKARPLHPTTLHKKLATKQKQLQKKPQRQTQILEQLGALQAEQVQVGEGIVKDIAEVAQLKERIANQANNMDPAPSLSPQVLAQVKQVLAALAALPGLEAFAKKVESMLTAVAAAPAVPAPASPQQPSTTTGTAPATATQDGNSSAGMECDQDFGEFINIAVKDPDGADDKLLVAMLSVATQRMATQQAEVQKLQEAWSKRSKLNTGSASATGTQQQQQQVQQLLLVLPDAKPQQLQLQG